MNLALLFGLFFGLLLFLVWISNVHRIRYLLLVGRWPSSVGGRRVGQPSDGEVERLKGRASWPVDYSVKGPGPSDYRRGRGWGSKPRDGGQHRSHPQAGA